MPKERDARPKHQHGGAREGAGRPPKPKLSQLVIRCEKMDSAIKPHEVLAAIARGMPMTAQYFDEVLGAFIGEPFAIYPTLDQRIQAAIEAAPYFASKMASIQTYVPPEGGAGGNPPEGDAAELSDEELARIARTPAVQPAKRSAGTSSPQKDPKGSRGVGRSRKA